MSIQLPIFALHTDPRDILVDFGAHTAKAGRLQTAMELLGARTRRRGAVLEVFGLSGGTLGLVREHVGDALDYQETNSLACVVASMQTSEPRHIHETRGCWCGR